MKLYAFITSFLALVGFITAGCSSQLPRENAANGISAFLGQDRHYALYTPVSIKAEEKLQFFGVEDYGEKITKQFRIQDPVVGVIERFVKSIPDLSETIIVPPEEANSLSLPPDHPVLFFHSDWRLVYRRLPPDFAMNQLQVGVVAKIIPLGQVLSGKGPVALRTSFWEDKCFFKAFGGKFISLDDWLEPNGSVLNHGIESAQIFCADKFISNFLKR